MEDEYINILKKAVKDRDIDILENTIFSLEDEKKELEALLDRDWTYEDAQKLSEVQHKISKANDAIGLIDLLEDKNDMLEKEEKLKGEISALEEERKKLESSLEGENKEDIEHSWNFEEAKKIAEISKEINEKTEVLEYVRDQISTLQDRIADMSEKLNIDPEELEQDEEIEESELEIAEEDEEEIEPIEVISEEQIDSQEQQQQPAPAPRQARTAQKQTQPQQPTPAPRHARAVQEQTQQQSGNSLEEQRATLIAEANELFETRMGRFDYDHVEVDRDEHGDSKGMNQIEGHIKPGLSKYFTELIEKLQQADSLEKLDEIAKKHKLGEYKNIYEQKMEEEQEQAEHEAEEVIQDTIETIHSPNKENSTDKYLIDLDTIRQEHKILDWISHIPVLGKLAEKRLINIAYKAYAKKREEYRKPIEDAINEKAEQSETQSAEERESTQPENSSHRTPEGQRFAESLNPESGEYHQEEQTQEQQTQGQQSVDTEIEIGDE